jgi:hypothetical protein
MDPIKAAHLEVAKKVYTGIVKDFQMERVAVLLHDDPKQIERALDAAASFAYQAAETFTCVYRMREIESE